MRNVTMCGRRWLLVSVWLVCSLFSAGTAYAEGETEGRAFCEVVKQRADAIMKDWNMTDLTLFGCHVPSATKVSDSPLGYQASATMWLTGTTVTGESVKARREVRGLMTKAAGSDAWTVEHLEYGQIEALGFFTQVFAWMAWVVAFTVVCGVAAAFARLFLPNGLVNVTASLIMIGFVWSAATMSFGSTAAAACCTVVYLGAGLVLGMMVAASQ